MGWSLHCPRLVRVVVVAEPGATLVGPTQSFPTTPLQGSLAGETDPAQGKWCNRVLSGS